MSTSKSIELGYRFHTPAEGKDYVRCLHPQLDVVMQTEPSGQHFDPTSLQITAVVNGYTQHLTFHHPIRNSITQRLAAGRILLNDRIMKTVEGFAFGGELHGRQQNGSSLFEIRSDAPILAIASLNSPITLFVSEVEVLLGRYKAQLNQAHGLAFEARLAQIEPVDLYAACVRAIQTTAPTHLLGGPLAHLLNVLETDLAARLGQTAVVPTLDALFNQSSS